MHAKGLAALTALAAAALVAVAGAAAGPPAVLEGGQPNAFSAGFSPRRLPGSGSPAPVAFHFSAQSPAPGPGLHELLLRLDRNVTVEAAGLPGCPLSVEGPLPPERCRPALVGKGRIEVEVSFPESPPFTTESTLWAFKRRAGKNPDLLLYAELSSPVSAGIVAEAKVRRIEAGRYGSEWTVAFPKIAGGYGSLRRLELTLERRYSRGDEKTSFLLARCPDEHLDIDATAVFGDGSLLEEPLVRACARKD